MGVVGGIFLSISHDNQDLTPSWAGKDLGQTLSLTNVIYRELFDSNYMFVIFNWT